MWKSERALKQLYDVFSGNIYRSSYRLTPYVAQTRGVLRGEDGYFVPFKEVNKQVQKRFRKDLVVSEITDPKNSMKACHAEVVVTHFTEDRESLAIGNKWLTSDVIWTSTARHFFFLQDCNRCDVDASTRVRIIIPEGVPFDVPSDPYSKRYWIRTKDESENVCLKPAQDIILPQNYVYETVEDEQTFITSSSEDLRILCQNIAQTIWPRSYLFHMEHLNDSYDEMKKNMFQLYVYESSTDYDKESQRRSLELAFKSLGAVPGDTNILQWKNDIYLPLRIAGEQIKGDKCIVDFNILRLVTCKKIKVVGRIEENDYNNFRDFIQ